jgi:hypothetical protein
LNAQLQQEHAPLTVVLVKAIIASAAVADDLAPHPVSSKAS